MGTNFRILVHKNSHNLHLKLHGDFDGSSARQLLNTISKLGGRSDSVFIHTAGLCDIQPMGCDIFQMNVSSLSRRFSEGIIYTGAKAQLLAPTDSKIM
nr:hypothetical protein [Deltaproteobacteria bacterium]